MRNTRKAREKKKMELKSLEAAEGETRVKVKEMKELAAKRPRKSATKSPIPPGMKVGQYIQIEVQRLLAGQDPKSRDPKSRLQTMIESVYKRAIDMRSGQGKASAELLLNYGYEKPKPAVDELDAMAKSGFQVVYVNHPELKDVPKMELPAAPNPDFIEAEIVEEI